MCVHAFEVKRMKKEGKVKKRRIQIFIINKKEGRNYNVCCF